MADPSHETTGDDTGTLPKAVVDAAERLTRRARRASDDAEETAYRTERDERLADYGYTARIRDVDDVLVCYPTEWTKDGVIRPEQVDDVDRGVERHLSGPGNRREWDDISRHNDELVESVEADADTRQNGDADADTARALADFASNHYAKRIEDLTQGELREFLTEYFPRNAWPSDDQKAVVEDSLGVVFEKTDVECPLDR